MYRLRIAVSVVALAGLLATSGFAAAASPKESRVDSDMAFRAAVGLRSDENYVRALYDAADSTDEPEPFGALLTESEEAELLKRIDLERDGDAIAAWFANHDHSELYGGLYIDHQQGGVLAVLATDRQAAMQLAWVRDLRYPSRLDVREVKYSVDELERLRTKIRAAWLEGDPSTKGLTELYVDIRENRVVARFDNFVSRDAELGGLPAAFHARFSSPTLDGAAALPIEAAVDLTSVAGPIDGGVGWGVSPAPNYRCTIGFTVYGPDPDFWWLLTAGHCIHSDELGEDVHFYHGGDKSMRYVGKIDDYRAFSGQRDFALLRAKTDFPDPRGLVWKQTPGTGNGLRYQVKGVTTAYQVGYLRCFTGQTTNGTQCGEIEIASDDVTYDNYGGKVLTNQWVLDVGAGNAPIAGDSGGPVFRFDVPAAGSGWIYATGVVGAKRGNRYATGPKWNNIPAGWDVEVRTAP